MLIAADDVRLLRTLAERDFSVSLVCPGLPTYHAHVKALLKRVLPVPGEPLWYVPTTLTGPLRQALPERPAP